MQARKRGPSMGVDDLEASSKNDHSSVNRRSTKGESGSGKFQLTCVPPQDFKYPFVNQWFNIQVMLTDSKKAFKKDWVIPIQVDLLYEDGSPVNPSPLEISPSTPAVFNGDGLCTLQMRITQTSMDHENRAFTLRFAIANQPPIRMINSTEPLPAATLSLLSSIPPCYIENFSVVRYRIKIETQPPENWYKDEGGRDKCMSIRGALVDENDRLVTGQDVPLTVTLCYEPTEVSPEPTEVKNQSILRAAEGSTQKVDINGRIEVKVRIEEVSKNHQKQSFMLRLAPNVAFSPANAAIAPAMTTAITVLSKRNKRRKKDDHYTPMLNPMSLGNLNQTMHSPLSTLARHSVGSLHPPTLPTDLRPSVPLTNALQSINNWCQYVIRGLNSLEWQHVGFEITENGDVHLQRPLHRCPSCWTYKDSIRPAQHNEKCMLYKAKYTFHNETQQYLQQLQMLAMGQSVKQEPLDPNTPHKPDGEDSSDVDSNDEDDGGNDQHSAGRPVRATAMDMFAGMQGHNASSDDLPPVNPPMMPSLSQAYQNQSFMAGIGYPGAGSFDFPSMPTSMVHSGSFDGQFLQAQYYVDEQQVYAIFLTGGLAGQYTLAAYNKNHQCLGFYEDEPAPKGVNLKALTYYQTQQNWPSIDNFIKSRQHEFERALASREPTVFLRSSYPSIQDCRDAAALADYSKRRSQQ